MAITTPPFRTSLLTANGAPFATDNGDIQTTRDWWMYWNQLTDRSNSNSKLAGEGSHADRPDPGSMPDGAIYIEADRGAIYSNEGGTWQYIAGTMYGTLSPDQRPTDLGTHDAGFEFRGTDVARQFLWSQTAWVEVTAVQYGTHAARPAPATIVEGALYVESDRGGVIYQRETPAGTPLWQYLAGTMWGTLSPDQRPSGLGVHDAGFDFRSTDPPPREFIWNQTAWVETTPLVDPTTTKGDVLVRGPSIVTRLGVGAPGTVLTANATSALGVDWEIPPGGSGSTTGVSSVFGRTGAVTAFSGDYNAGQVTNAVSTLGSYSDPAWITALAWSKITGTPATGVSTVFGRSGTVVATAGDYTAAKVTNAVDTTQTYANPAWLTSLAWSKVTGAPAFLTALTPWTSNINASSFSLINTNGVYINSPASLAALHVRASDIQFLIEGTTATKAAVFIVSNAAGDPTQGGLVLQRRTPTAGFEANLITVNLANGNLGLGVLTPTFALQLAADSAGKPGTSTWSVVSDLRLKQNMEPVKDDSLAIIGKLDWIRYEYNGLAKTPDGLKAIGLVAQELQKQLPEAVRSTKTRLNETDAVESDVLAIDYHHILVHSARAIQQLRAELESLKALIGKPQP